MKAKNQFSLSSKYWLLILAVICIILMGLSGFADTGQGPLSWVAGYTIVPMQKGINRVGMWMSDPVSYTHLDVYKRQVLRPSLPSVKAFRRPRRSTATFHRNHGLCRDTTAM